MKWVALGVVALVGGDPDGPLAAHEHRRRAADRAVRLPVRDGVVAADRRARLVVQPDQRHDGGDAAAHLPDLPAAGLDGADLLRHRAVGRRHRLHRRLERRHHLAGPEDRLPGRRDAARAADRDHGRRAAPRPSRWGRSCCR